MKLSDCLRLAGVISADEWEPIPKLTTLQTELDVIIFYLDDYDSLNSFDLYIYQQINENEKNIIVKTKINVSDKKMLKSLWIDDVINADYSNSYKALLGEENFLKVKDFLKSEVIEGEFDRIPEFHKAIITIV